MATISKKFYTKNKSSPLERTLLFKEEQLCYKFTSYTFILGQSGFLIFMGSLALRLGSK